MEEELNVHRGSFRERVRDISNFLYGLEKLFMVYFHFYRAFIVTWLAPRALGQQVAWGATEWNDTHAHVSG
jgi:hypothetical protein